MTTTQDPIAHASRLLREAAEELRQAHAFPGIEGWENETDAKAAYDEHMAAAQALEDWEAAVGAGGVQPLRSVQEGCKLVPLEPTQEMLAALMSPGEAEALASSPSETFALMLMDRAGIRERYSAMLVAAPQHEAQEPCPTCAALARKPDCYGIRQITDDEGIEEWADIRTSPDVAREEANDMMATGRGELYEVVPLWTTPQPSLTAKAADSVLEDAARLDWLALAGPTSICVVIDRPHDGEVEVSTDDVTGYGKTLREALDAARKQDAPKAAPGGSAASLAVPDNCPHILWFDDQDLKPVVFAGDGAKRAALEAYRKASMQWNAHLFVRIAVNSRDYLYPCAAPQQEAQEPYAYAVYFPDQPKVELVHDLDELIDDLTNRQHTVTKLYTAPQPAPAPLSEMPYEKRKAIQEGEQIGASDAWFHARLNMLDTLDRRNVFRAGFDRGWNAALAAQGGK